MSELFAFISVKSFFARPFFSQEVLWNHFALFSVFLKLKMTACGSTFFHVFGIPTALSVFVFFWTFLPHTERINSFIINSFLGWDLLISRKMYFYLYIIQYHFFIYKQYYHVRLRLSHHYPYVSKVLSRNLDDMAVRLYYSIVYRTHGIKRHVFNKTKGKFCWTVGNALRLSVWHLIEVSNSCSPVFWPKVISRPDPSLWIFCVVWSHTDRGKQQLTGPRLQCIFGLCQKLMLCVKTLLPVKQTANLAETNASEEDKIKAMMSQSNHEYDPIKYVCNKRPVFAQFLLYQF